MLELIQPYLSQIIISIGGLFAWFFERKKRLNIIKQDDADLTKKIQEIYRDMVADSDANMDNLREDIVNLKKRQAEIDDNWKTKLVQVEKRWQSKYSRLQKSYNALQKEFDAYKLKHESK